MFFIFGGWFDDDGNSCFFLLNSFKKVLFWSSMDETQLPVKLVLIWFIQQTLTVRWILLAGSFARQAETKFLEKANLMVRETGR